MKSDLYENSVVWKNYFRLKWSASTIILAILFGAGVLTEIGAYPTTPTGIPNNPVWIWAREFSISIFSFVFVTAIQFRLSKARSWPRLIFGTFVNVLIGLLLLVFLPGVFRVNVPKIQNSRFLECMKRPNAEIESCRALAFLPVSRDELKGLTPPSRPIE